MTYTNITKVCIFINLPDIQMTYIGMYVFGVILGCITPVYAHLYVSVFADTVSVAVPVETIVHVATVGLLPTKPPVTVTPLPYTPRS